MNRPWHSQKQKNWQWRIIILASLLIIFGKEIGDWFSQILSLSFEQLISVTASAANKAGLIETLNSSSEESSPKPALTIDVKNDTPNEYIIQPKITSGELNFSGNNFAVGEIKRFTVKSSSQDGKEMGTGDIFFISVPLLGKNNTTCQEIHILNYDLKYAEQIKQPLFVNLSAIASRLECKPNAPQSLE